MYGCLATLRRFLLLTPEVQIVPKLAATLASLLLIASSIGVNIARYPQVGRIIDAGPPTATAAIANSEPARSPQIAVITPAENARVGGPFDPTPAAGPAEAAGAAPSTLGPGRESRTETAVTILDVRPMVPVAGVQSAGASDPTAGPDEVRRLPPVEPSVPAVDDLQAAGPDETGQYPATATP